MLSIIYCHKNDLHFGLQFTLHCTVLENVVKLSLRHTCYLTIGGNVTVTLLLPKHYRVLHTLSITLCGKLPTVKICALTIWGCHNSPVTTRDVQGTVYSPLCYKTLAGHQICEYPVGRLGRRRHGSAR